MIITTVQETAVTYVEQNRIWGAYCTKIVPRFCTLYRLSSQYLRISFSKELEKCTVICGVLVSTRYRDEPVCVLRMYPQT